MRDKKTWHKRALPNRCRAIISGKIATIYKGRRIVREYESGQPLVGRFAGSNAPPYTGFVRGKRYD